MKKNNTNEAKAIRGLAWVTISALVFEIWSRPLRKSACAYSQTFKTSILTNQAPGLGIQAPREVRTTQENSDSVRMCRDGYSRQNPFKQSMFGKDEHISDEYNDI